VALPNVLSPNQNKAATAAETDPVTEVENAASVADGHRRVQTGATAVTETNATAIGRNVTAENESKPVNN